MNEALTSALKAITDQFDSEAEKKDATLTALLGCECQILFQNQYMIDFLSKKAFFRKSHEELYEKSKNEEVLQYIDDVLMMAFEE